MYVKEDAFQKENESFHVRYGSNLLEILKPLRFQIFYEFQTCIIDHVFFCLFLASKLDL